MAKLGSSRIHGIAIIDSDLYLGGGITINGTRRDVN